ncbi:hypothetical protein [Pantoea stewartii]|uniref:hypothetical protein n=1 Tax=Pantoea stewartii TaxID=66269 RepID=UPI00259FE428|nr:hypothetical protein [Pantoea stewartii]
MTNFHEMGVYGLLQQSTTFEVAGVNYEVYFIQITDKNSYDSAVEFPKGFSMPDNVKHYDVTFDSDINMKNKTNFQRTKGLPAGAGTRVLKCIERIIIDHYTKYRVGLYSFAPADHKLTSVYCRIVSKKKHKGSTIEVGLEPEGKANVLRTPRFY